MNKEQFLEALRLDKMKYLLALFLLVSCSAENDHHIAYGFIDNKWQECDQYHAGYSMFCRIGSSMYYNIPIHETNFKTER